MALLRNLERAARLGMRLGGIASRVRQTTNARVHFFDASGQGDLPPVVIIHGIGSNATPYWPMISRIRKVARRVIAPESPGHGLSEPPVVPLTPDSLFAGVSELLAAELTEPAIVFGNSLGGAIALRYALEQPARVKGLVLSSPGGATMTPAELEALIGHFRHEDLAASRAFIQRLYHRAPWYAPLLGRDIHALMARPSLKELLASIRREHLFTAEQVGALSVPALLLWGTADVLMPRSNLEFFRRSLPPHVLIEEPVGFSHCPYLEHTVELSDRVVSFARSLPM